MDIVERLRGDYSDERLELAADEIDRLRKANKVQACTIRSLQYSKSKIVYEAHIAVKTLDGEKEANAILTDEIERLQYALMKVCNSLDDNLPAIITKNIALAALGCLRGE